MKRNGKQKKRKRSGIYKEGQIRKERDMAQIRREKTEEKMGRN